MKTKKVLKFSKETVIILDKKSKKGINGGQDLQLDAIEPTKRHSCVLQC